jgi:PhoH-like ATPase
MRIIVDTNTLLNGLNPSEYEKVYIPITVIEELDKLKMSENTELAYRSRQAIKLIKSASNVKSILECSGSLPTYLNPDKADNIILKYAKDITTTDKKCVLLTGDFNMICKAKAMEIPCEEWNGVSCDIEYKGYKKISGNTEFINKFFEDIDNGINTYGFLQNEYLILYDECSQKTTEMRYDNGQFVKINLPPGTVIKAKNSEQRCALDILMNEEMPIKIIVGTFGSGKSLLTTKVGIYLMHKKKSYDSVMFLRNPITADGTDIGFLPGSKQEKIEDFCRPFLQYVKNDYAKNPEQAGNFVDTLINAGKIKMDVVSYLKGLNIENTFVIMDEAEDLNTKLVKLVGSRIGTNACIVFTGDWKQCESKYKNDNGLTKIIQECKGNPLVGIVVLTEDLRSAASKVFADL